MYVDGILKFNITSPKIKTTNMTFEKNLCLGNNCIGGFPFSG